MSDWFAGDVDCDGEPLVTIREADLAEMVAIAFEAGCRAVHENYQEDRDPDFTEAAYDYARSVVPAQKDTA